MSDPKRPDPDLLLRRIKAEEQEKRLKGGRLKIFLGANAGVGKTYRMLSQARIQKEAGIDLVVGLVETHGRSETEALLERLEIIPRRKINYEGLTLEEMDLDLVLQRKPKLVLVDELAHTNAPGSRHAKRYQDVEELLDAGISVYTTLNIQHIESLNDLVYQIAGVHVSETVPDHILEMATGPDGIELVDLPPQELIQRMQEGKVYIAPKAKQAMERFFQKGNLIALREMSLRYAARLVDQDKRTYMEEHGIEGPWGLSSRILVCFGSGKLSEKVLRLAKQLSPGIDDEWYALHVQSPLQTGLGKAAQEQLTQNARLAERLGGKVVFMTGQSIAHEILSFAQRHYVSLILVGWHPRWGWKRLFQGSLVNTLVRESGQIHVMVVTGSDEKAVEEKREQNAKPLPNWKGIASAAGLVGVTAGVCWLLRSRLQFIDIAMILLLPAIAGGVAWGKQAGILASALAVFFLYFFLAQPTFSFVADHLQHFPAFFVFLLVGISSSFLSDTLRRQRESARQSERFVSLLYDLSQQLLSLYNMDELLQQASSTISKAFQCEVKFFLPDGLGRLHVRSQVSPAGAPSEHEWGVADWVFQHGQPAGRGTDTLSSAKFHYLPLKTQTNVVGVLGVRLVESADSLAAEQTHLLMSLANIVAIAIARILRLR